MTTLHIHLYRVDTDKPTHLLLMETKEPELHQAWCVTRDVEEFRVTLAGVPDLDWEKVKVALGSNAVFTYDCLVPATVWIPLVAPEMLMGTQLVN